MKYLLNLLLLSFILLNNTACTNLAKSDLSKNNKISQAKLKPSDYHQSCQFLFNSGKELLTQGMVWACLVETQTAIYPQLIDKLLSHKPALTKKYLATALMFVTMKKETVENSSLVKKLLDAGAPTTDVTMNNVLILNANICESVTMIVKSNPHKYKSLHMFTYINLGYDLCPKAIQVLASYNPKLLDDQDGYGMTPLQHYLTGVDHPKWNVNTAKLLMTKNNVKLKDKKGYTPLHYIQLYMTNKKSIYNSLIQMVDKHSNKKTDTVALQKSVDGLILKNRPKCHSLINNKVLNQKNITECFYLYDEFETPYLINKLLEHKPPISKKILSDLITMLANDMFNAVHTKSLEKLIKAGASTENISAPSVIYNNSHSCNSLMLILRKNSALYENQRFLNSAPKTNDRTSSSRNTDLHSLSAVGLERGICPEAIQFLAKNHPHLRNVQEKYGNSTPLHIYLGDTHWADWDLETLKTLISKKNINMQDNYGNTPLHSLNSGAASHIIGEHEIRIIKMMMEHGADITIKNKKGKSPQDMYEDKNPKLKALFNQKSK